MSTFLEFLLKVGIMLLFVGAALYLKIYESRRARDQQVEIDRIMKENTKRLRLEKLNNPFPVIFDELKSSLKNGVYFRIKANVSSFFMITAWAVKIDKLYEELDSRSVLETFYTTAENETSGSGVRPCQLLRAASTEWSLERVSNADGCVGEREFHYAIPASCLARFQDQERLNRVRDVYQLVIVLYRDPADLAEMQSHEIATSIQVYHFKDNDKLNTKLLHSFSKRLNNELINVNKIFEQNELCVVCQTENSDQLVLPCAHKCLCAGCLPRCQDKCPVCREKVVYSFKLD